MSYENPNAILIDSNGNNLPVQNNVIIPASTPGLIHAGRDTDGYARYLYTSNIGSLHTIVDTLPVDTYSVATVVASSSGNTTIVSPAAGKKIRLHYLTMNADGANSVATTCSIRYTTSGTLMYTMSLVAGSTFARNVGAGRRYIEGAINQDLVINLSAAQTINCTVEYEAI